MAETDKVTWRDVVVSIILMLAIVGGFLLIPSVIP